MTMIGSLLPSHSAEPVLGRPETGYNSKLRAATLTLATFSWLITNSAVSFIHDSQGRMKVPSNTMLWSPWPYTLSSIHLASSAAALYLASFLALFQPTAHACTRQTSSWLGVLGQGLCAVIVATLVLVLSLMTLPPIVFVALMITSACLIKFLDAALASVASISFPKLGFPALLSLFALFTSSSAYGIPIFTITCFFVALSISIYLVQSTIPTISGPAQCRTLALQLALAGGLLKVAEIVVACTAAGTEGSQLISPLYSSVPVLYLFLIANSAVLTISISTLETRLWSSLAGPMAVGVTLAILFWLGLEVVNMSDLVTAHILSAVAVVLCIWTLARRLWADRHGTDMTLGAECNSRSVWTARHRESHIALIVVAFLTVVAIHLSLTATQSGNGNPPGFSIRNDASQFLSPLESQTPPIHALVTGGAGFVGSHFIRHLLASEPTSKVIILDNLSTAGFHTVAPLIHTHGRDRVHFILGDVGNSTLVRSIVNAARPNVIVHLVTPKMGPMGECDAACQTTLFNGTRAVVEAASTLDPLPRIVLASSSDVYGPLPSLVKPGTWGVFFEQDPLHLVTPVASAMADAEQIVASHARLAGSTAFILRLFPIIGPTAVPEPANMDPRRWAGAGIVLDKQVGEDLSKRVDTMVDWVHISDVCQALLRAVTVETNPNVDEPVGRAHVVNVGSGTCGGGNSRSNCTRADISTAAKLLDYHPQFPHVNRTDMQRLQADADADPRTHPEYDSLVASLSTSPWLLPRSLLWSTYAPLANNLTALAHYTAQHRSPAQHAKTLTIVPFQSGYRSMVENALYSLMTWGKVRNLLVFAIDAESAAECLYLNMPCFNATSLATADFTNPEGLDPRYRGKIWSVISWVKPRVVRALLRLGYTVNLSDADIGFLRNVWLSYDDYMREVGADMSITSEISHDYEANTGNYVVRPTPESLHFFDEYIAIGEADPTISDQHAFTKVFRNLTMSFCASPETCASQRARGRMPIREYSPLFGRHNLCPHPIDTCKPDMLYVHPICIAGREDKVKALKRFGAWNMADGKFGFYCEEKDKVGGIECPGVPRALANGYVSGMEEEWKQDVGGQWCLGSVAKLTNAANN